MKCLTGRNLSATEHLAPRLATDDLGKFLPDFSWDLQKQTRQSPFPWDGRYRCGRKQGKPGSKAFRESQTSFYGKLAWLTCTNRYYIAVHDMFYREKPELHEEHLLTRWPSKASFGLLTGPREKTAYPRQEEDVKSNYPRPWSPLRVTGVPVSSGVNAGKPVLQDRLVMHGKAFH